MISPVLGWVKDLVLRVISIADESTDDDDLRLRKRVGVAAGVITIVAPLTLPIQTRGDAVTWTLGGALAVYSLGNLAVLAASHRFERYVIALLLGGVVFVPLATAVGGGLTQQTTGLAWGFLVPAYALMALGPSRAVMWFVVFLGMVLFMVAIDPFVHSAFRGAPYVPQLTGQVLNGVIPLSVVFVLLRYIDTRRRTAEARVDELLTNAIPRSIATRLKHGEERIAEAYPDATILFSDIVDFTPWAQRTDPDRVVGLLDQLFTEFDKAAADCGVEKIKTIGDAYMAVAGVPEPRSDHAEAALNLASRMLAVADAWRRSNDLSLQVRIGLASGPVVAGVIGQKRILFDLWGDTVNTASRMESSGVPGRIQVAPSTHAVLAGHHAFEAREPIDVKGLGPMATYLVADS
jgi:adenylate cyclase